MTGVPNVYIGAELEYAVTMPNGEDPFPFRPAYYSMREMLAVDGVHFELGPSQVEIITDVAKDGQGLIPSAAKGLDVVRDLLGGNGCISTAQYLPQFVCSGSEMLLDSTLSARHKAILLGLQREEPVIWEQVARIGGAQSLHCHVSLHDADGTPWSFDPREVTEASEIANLLVNYLNATAPYYAHEVARRYGMPDPTERIRLWFEYCALSRMPQCAWHTRESRMAWFRSLPRLIGLRDGATGNLLSDWIILPGCGSEPWNVIDAGLQRDLVRLSPPRDTLKPWTLEIRALSIVPKLWQVAEVGDELISMVKALIKLAIADMEDVDLLFRRMHEQFPFLPSKRPTRDEWRRCLGLK